MAWRFPLSTSGSGRQIDLGDGFDDLYVAAQVFIASTDDDTVRVSAATMMSAFTEP